MVDLASDMIRTDIVRKNFYYLDDSFYRKLNITRDFYEKYLGRYNYLIELKDGYYYTKDIKEKKLCNEIIGRYLCHKVALETTPLELLLDLDDLKIVTPNYRKEDKVYIRPDDDKKVIYSSSLNVDKLFLLDKEYQKEQFKLIAIDMMMEQTDRYGCNMEEIIENDKKHLAPVIDFSLSFDFFTKYHNPYANIPKTVKSLDKFLDIFSEAYPYFSSIFETDASELVSYIEDNYPIKIESKIVKTYKEVTDKNQKILRKLK